MSPRTWVLWCLITVAVPASSAQVRTSDQKSLGGATTPCESGYLKRGTKCIAVAVATDKEIRALLITESLAGYYGSCPCPYNVDRAGRSCGRRSAYSRPGGRSPRCYESDITDSEVKAFRERSRARP